MSRIWSDDEIYRWTQKPLPWWVHTLCGLILGIALTYLVFVP